MDFSGALRSIVAPNPPKPIEPPKEEPDQVDEAMKVVFGEDYYEHLHGAPSWSGLLTEAARMEGA